ncbi:rod shape-determining protein MreC [Roseofilum casamattae]|uniref:Cell shape-determining protein MreC n=1 Tax=Roseofilum casamattae BLCC-M143 TaxID=3022442 RepID=A0ABT7C0P7_9CYAN|nr:rod shape-determining protein MreC [Roseofilum casamattae]MDJ1185025.1 rod shape-determining protein MreC [Roseofilum casamattae BLCC-M143]
MYIRQIRRWWERNWLQLVLMVLALGLAVYVRQTQGNLVFELYGRLLRPLHANPAQQEQLENARLLELESKVEELEQQNSRLKQLIDYQEQSKREGVIAPIVGRSADHWWKQITLGRGSRDGIEKDFIVTGTGGLVGRVIAVTENTSRVLLLSDPTSRVGATIRVGTDRSFMGILQGRGQNKAVMEFFDKVPDVQPGYKVFTSPYSPRFQSGLLVGVVESVDLKKNPAPEAIVRFSSPIGHLEWVMVSEGKPALDLELNELNEVNESDLDL